MWNGSGGQYRPNQPSQHSQSQHPQSLHATWTSGLNPQRPNRQPSANSGSPIAYLDPHRPHHTPPTPSANDGLPEPPKAFPELEGMSLKELKLLDEEKAKFDDFIAKHEYQKKIDAVVGRIRGDVEKFQKEHDLITAKMGEMVDERGLEQLRGRIASMEEEVKGLQKLKEEWLENNSSERLMDRLRMAIGESEGVADGLEKRMLSSSINFDEFLQQYIECRKLYHERTFKLEHLKKESRKRSMGR